MKTVKELMIDKLKVKEGFGVHLVYESEFERVGEITENYIPHDKGELLALLETAPREKLLEMGCRVWTTYEREKDMLYLKEGEVHYLYPYEWYEYTDGVYCWTVGGFGFWMREERELRERIFGCLGYGFIRKEEAGRVLSIRDI